jgi:protein-arginine kinase activator protein McsA
MTTLSSLEMATTVSLMRVNYKTHLKTHRDIFRLHAKNKPYKLSIDEELVALESLLQSAVQREKYELAAIIKERMDLVRIISKEKLTNKTI